MKDRKTRKTEMKTTEEGDVKDMGVEDREEKGKQRNRGKTEIKITEERDVDEDEKDKGERREERNKEGTLK